MMSLTKTDFGKKNKTWEIRLKLKLTMTQKTMLPNFQHFHKPTSGLKNCSEGHFRDNARIGLEQNSDIVLRNLRAKIEGNPFDENDLASDYRYQHYLQNLIRVEIKQEVLTRKY